MSRLTADDRVRRLLSIVPWIAARPDGVPIDELCRRFDVDDKHLVADLMTLSFVGVYPFSPDAQVELVIEGERVFVHLPQWFDRPLRLTPEQGLALVAAGQSLLSIPGADVGGPLARGLAKIADSLGVRAEEAVEVDLGPAEADTMNRLRAAIDDHRQVELQYYSYGRDEQTTRVVDPYRLHADQGKWYLTAWCHVAEGERIFRVDRIREVTTRKKRFAPPTEAPSLGVFAPAADDPRVVLELQPDARWVLDHYPVEAVEPGDGEAIRVTLAVTARPWLERLLLRLGPDAEIVAAPDDLRSCANDAAARVLARYRTPGVPTAPDGA